MEIRKYEGSETRNFLRRVGKLMHQRPHVFSRPCAHLQRLCGNRWKATEAAELVEFALLLPVLLVMVVGLMDFATAYNIKQKLANAAREGARLGSSQPTCDLSTGSPASIQAIKDDVTTYLEQAGVNTSFINSNMTYDTSSLTATYYTSSGGTNYGLEIERNVQVDSSGTVLPSTRVTLIYPYDWTYGFNHLIRLLIPSAGSITQISIPTDALMVNLAGC